MNTSTRRLLASSALATILAASCGSSIEPTATATDQTPESAESVDSSTPGIRLISPEDGAAIQSDPPADLVILDVRTSEEFAESHLEGAVMIDFYRDDFADQLAELDPDVPYLVYCRSGNRSGQTTTMMEQLGFADVADVDGGIVSWADAGLATVTG